MQWMHYVYLIGMMEGDRTLPYTKVGVANSICSRMSALSTGTPFRVFCEGFFGFDNKKEAYATERGIQRHLRVVHETKEWFRGSPSDIYRAIVPEFLARDRFQKWDNGKGLRDRSIHRLGFPIP